jgi:hypothetical protein
MIVPIPYVHAGMGVLAVLLSLPLLFRIVPMNRIYGIRVPEAFVSERNWYQINSFGGFLITVFGLFLLGFSYFGRPYAPAPTSIWAPVFLAAPLVAIVPVVALIKYAARRLPDR